MSLVQYRHEISCVTPVSGPLLDRIDVTVHVQPIPPTELSRAPPGEPSAAVAARVAMARTAQRTRYGDDGPATNAEAELGEIVLQPDARALAETVTEKLRLSARGFTRVLRVGRTIADLACAAQVRRADVAEALAYRPRIPGRPG